jgi:hypothetical protein
MSEPPVEVLWVEGRESVWRSKKGSVESRERTEMWSERARAEALKLSPLMGGQ